MIKNGDKQEIVINDFSGSIDEALDELSEAMPGLDTSLRIMLDSLNISERIIVGEDDNEWNKDEAYNLQMEKLEQEMEALQEKMDRLRDMNDDSPPPMIINGDTTFVRIGKWKFKIDADPETANAGVCIDNDVDDCTPKNFETRWGMLDLGLNNWMNDGALQIPSPYSNMELNMAKSVNVQIHILRQRLNLISNHVNLEWGVTLDVNNFRFANDFKITPKMDSLTLTGADHALSKNKLVADYASVPFLLQFESNPSRPKHSFHLGVGGVGAYLISAHTKQRSEEDGKVKQRDDFSLNPIRYGTVVRIGYGWFNLYAQYNLSPAFSDGKGPLVNTAEAGITLVGF